MTNGPSVGGRGQLLHGGNVLGPSPQKGVGTPESIQLIYGIVA
jgi:hypothetical protein